ncbi:MAG TPA: HEAT repeat domain-containing protein, partial [Candidatus Lokiarchaeia archaeon]
MPNPDEIYKNINQIGRIEVIKQLHELYSLTEDKKVRIRILELLNQLSDKAHFNEIESYFISDEDPYVRIEAAKLLAFNYEDKKAIKPLIWVIENEVAKDVKKTALRLLVALAQVKK